MDASGPKRVKKRTNALSRPFVVTIAAVGIPALGVAAAMGCGQEFPEAGGNGGNKFPGNDAYCQTEGATRDCHVDLGKDAKSGFSSCYVGKQTCLAHVWSACGGDGTIVATKRPDLSSASDPGTQGGGLHILKATVDGGGDAGICAADPCNPYCQSYTGTPPTPEGGTSTISISGFGQIPGGQLNKLLNACNPGDPATCDGTPAGSGLSLYQCQVDTYCSLLSRGGSGCCEQFNTLEKYPSALNTGVYLGQQPGVDLTIGGGCNFTDKLKAYNYFPICNRGNTALDFTTITRAPDPGYIHVKLSNPAGQLPTNTCPANDPGPTFDCKTRLDENHMIAGPAVFGPTYTGAAGVNVLLPGTCFLMDMGGVSTGGAAGKAGTPDCTGGEPSGEKYLYVNPDYGVAGGVAEGSVTSSTPPGQVLQPGCANNWSDHAPANNPPSCFSPAKPVIDIIYNATCPPSYKAHWDYLVWDSAIPSSKSTSAEITFQARTANVDPINGGPGTFSAYYTVAEAKSNAGSDNADPEICAISGPANDNACTNANDTTCAQNKGPTPPCCPKNIEDQFSRPDTTVCTGTGGTVQFGGAGGRSQGKALAFADYLEILISQNNDASGAAPTLNNWSISYSCLPYE